MKHDINLNDMTRSGGRYYRAHAFRYMIFVLITIPIIISLLLLYLNPFWFRKPFNDWILKSWKSFGYWLIYRTWAIYLGCDPKVWKALNNIDN